MSERVPSYRLHKQSGQAVVTLTDGLGKRRDVLLGKYGTAASRAEYARVIAEWESAGRQLPGKGPNKDVTVNELALAFYEHAKQHYRRGDGTATTEVDEYKRALRVLKHLYGHTRTAEFGPLALKAVRESMVTGYDHPKYGPQGTLCRGVVNQRVGRLRRVFKWGCENEMVPPAVLAGLQAVRGLERGRSKARETAPVRPVRLEVVDQTLPHLTRQVRALVQVQLLTGMRPGEVCVMRGIDLDMTGKVWLYRPGSDQGPQGEHKTAHHGYQRVIAIGPKAQEVIRPFLKLDTHAYLFSPQEAIAEVRAERRRRRKTKVQPSQQDRRKRCPKKAPGKKYTTISYAHAVKGGCRKADAAAHAKDPSIPKEHMVVPHWHPHQLRHTRATELRREYGLDTARAVLGHTSPAVTEVYAELDTAKAAEVMGRIG
jgi:integrase